jgi:uracil-DNA glycosylase
VKDASATPDEVSIERDSRSPSCNRESRLPAPKAEDVRPIGTFSSLLEEVRSCTICAAELELGPRPIVQLSPQAKILIAGQAPGRRVHESGVAFKDASGDRLRAWMGITPDSFYDPTQVAILPMGFCYPGTGASGDLPPRQECAPAWRERIMGQLTQVRLTLVIGAYAQQFHLPAAPRTVTETVRSWREYGPEVVPLPHPSPRNNVWLKRNGWFEEELVPELRLRVSTALLGTNSGSISA